MLKSCNSDNKKYIRLTNQNIKSYIDSIPLDVEEITIWDYKMCLHPSAIQCKEAITVPSLGKFQRLRSFRCYGERLTTYPEMPVCIEQTLYVSCYINNEWVNSCVRHPKSYTPQPFQNRPSLTYSRTMYHKDINPLVVGSTSVNNNKEEWANTDDVIIQIYPTCLDDDVYDDIKPNMIKHRIMRPPPPPPSSHKPIWKCILNAFSFNPFTYIRNTRKIDENIPVRDSVCEMTTLVIPEPVITYDSIQRFKKTYDLVVNEGLIYVEYL